MNNLNTKIHNSVKKSTGSLNINISKFKAGKFKLIGWYFSKISEAG